MNRTEPRERNLRKIAVLVRSLDEEAADRLLAQMPLDRAAAVREAAEELGDVDERERREIVEEFLRATGRATPPARAESPSSATAAESGVELQLSSAARSSAARREPLPAARPEENSSERVAASTDRPLGFVTLEQTASLARWIAAERESTGAVVLSLLEPAIAARVLERLPLERQRSLLQRLAQQRPVERMIAEELSQAIRKAIADEAGTIESTVGRQAVEAILAQIRDAHRMRLVGASVAQAEQRGAPSVAARAVPIRTESNGAVSTDTSSAGTVPVPNLAPSQSMRRESLGANGWQDDRGPRILPIRSNSDSSGNAERPIAGPTRRNASEGGHATTASNAPTGRPASAPREPVLVSDEEASAIQARFDRLAGRSRARLVPLLKRIAPRVLRLALIGADPKLVARVVETLTRSEGKRLIDEIERPGAVRLSDIAAAQRVVLAAAEALDGSDRPTTMRPITA